MAKGEVWVAGGGMAGAVAALRARSCGARVRLYRRGWGATALSSGAVDVASDLSAPPGHPEPLEGDPFAAAVEIARTLPNHPYAVLRASLHRLRESLAFTAEALSELFPVPGDRNLLLPTALGTVKPTALAQWSQVGGDLRTLPSRVVVVQLANLPHPDARTVSLGVAHAAQGLGRGVEVQVVQVEGFGHLEDALRTPADWAAHWELAGTIEAFAQALKRVLPSSTEAVLLPPVFGTGEAETAGIAPMRRLSDALAPLRVAELLATTPSMPGLRLQATLDRALAKAAIEVVNGELPREKVPEAGAVILATGKYLGGGVVREGGFREPLFNLPVFIDGKPAQEGYVGRWLEASVEAGHAAFRAGVRVDGALRPLGRDLHPAMDRLFAAGSVISGYDPAADKTGLGVALFTGYLAGEQAARLVGMR